MKNNYPIKYAVIPIEEQIGWVPGLNELEREYGTVCYIVSKCYLVNDNKKYEKDGSITQKYYVVCPYYKDEYLTWHRQEPSFNYISNTCYNSIKVNNIFDNLEDAKKYKDDLNDELLTKKISYLPVKNLKEKIIETKKEFNKLLSHYNKLEEEIENQTQDLIVNNTPKEQTVIYYKNNEYSKNTSLYQMIDLFNHYNFIAYSLTIEEYKKLHESIRNNQPLDEFQNNTLLICNKFLKTIKVVSKTNKNKYIVDNEIVSKIDNKFINPSKYDVVLYTIEDYNDIINSYKNSEKQKIIQLFKNE